MKNVQIPEKLFINLVKYFLLEVQDADIYNAICKDIRTKYEAMEKRNLYTTYKTASTAEKQEQARLEYLDKAGMPGNFRF